MNLSLQDRVHDPSAERELAARASRGDDAALAVLFARHAAVLHRLAYRLLGSADEADDVVQDVFVGLGTALVHYDERGSFQQWLRRVTARVALMRLRADRRRRARAGRASPADAHDAHDAHDGPALRDDALRREIDVAIARLPDTLRAVVVLRMIEDYTHEEIASELGISIGAAKVRLHRAVRLLRPRLAHLRG